MDKKIKEYIIDAFTYKFCYIENDYILVLLEINKQLTYIKLTLSDYLFVEYISLPAGYFGKYSGNIIDSREYNYYWNPYLFVCYSMVYSFKEFKEYFKFKDKYLLEDVVLLYGTKNVFLLRLFNKELKQMEFLLYKDKKMYCFSDLSNEDCESITLDILTYKVYGIGKNGTLYNNIKYRLVEAIDYF